MSQVTSERVGSHPAAAPLPPFAPAMPVIGNAFDLHPDPLPFLYDQFRRLGPIYRIRLFGRDHTVLGGPSAVRFIARHGRDHFRSRDFWGAFAEEIGAETFLPGLDGDAHLRLRRLMKRSYSRGLVADRIPDVVGIVDELTRDWRDGEAVRVLPFVRRVVTEQLGRLMVGMSPGPRFDDFIVFVRTILSVTVTGTWPRAALYLPRYRRARRRVLAFGEQMVARRRRDGPGAHPDLLDDLIEASDADPGFLSPRDMMVATLGPFIAGLDTASNSAAFMLYAVHRHRDVFERVMAEVDAAFDGGPPTFDALRTMTALRGAYMETLRMYPVTPMIQRAATRAFEFEGFGVALDTHLFLGTGFSLRMPELYPDPERFDIDRFAPPRDEHKQPGAWAPYGQGAHICLGAGLGETQIMLSVATLLHRFRFTLRHDRPVKVTYNPLASPGTGFRLDVTRR